jgi:hypothetical protein
MSDGEPSGRRWGEDRSDQGDHTRPQIAVGAADAELALRLGSPQQVTALAELGSSVAGIGLHGMAEISCTADRGPDRFNEVL